MNKFITKVAKLVLGLSLAAGVGVAVGSRKQAEKADAAWNHGGTFVKMTNASFAAGDCVIFVSNDGTNALGDLSATSSGYGTAVSVTTSSNTITLTNSSTVTEFIVEAGATSGSWAFKAQNNTNFTNYYMSYNSTSTSKNNYLARYSTNTSSNTQAQFNVSYSNSHMVIRSVYNTGRWLRFNSDRFACYYSASSESTTGTNVQVFKKQISENDPALTDITSSPAKHTLSVGNTTGLTLSTTPSNAGSNVVAWTASPSTGVSFSTTSGNSTVVTFPTGANALAGGTVVTITATLTQTVAKTYEITAIANAGTSASPYNAKEAKALTLLDNDTGTHYVAAYIEHITNGGAIWLSDSSTATTGDFELYGTITNNTSITPADGQFILASGTFAKYNTTAEATDCTIHRIDVITLAHHELFVNNTQSETLSVSTAGGDVVWSTTAGTGSVSLSNQSNSSVTITGTSIGTATVTATVGTASASCAIEVREYATDWTYVDLTLSAGGTFNDTYYVNGTLDTTGLSVTLIEHSNTLNKNRETDIELEEVTFNFDANKGAAGTFTLTATYEGHTTDDPVLVHIIERAAGIEFNSNGLAISSSTLTGTANDSNGVSWTATAEFSGSVSITTTTAHCQVGAGSKRADSVSISMNLGSIKTFTSIAFKVNAFAGDSGDITMKLDGTEIATGSIDGTTEVIVGPSNYVRGQALTILIENEGNLRVNLISCEYYAYTDDEMVSNFVRDYMHMSYDEGGVHGSTGGDGSCKSQGWYTSAKTNYNKLFDPQKSLFNSESKYSAAKQRLIDWAVANDEVFNPSAYTFTANSGAKALLANVIGENTNTVAIIVIISLVSVTAIGGYFFLKKRREQN